MAKRNALVNLFACLVLALLTFKVHADIDAPTRALILSGDNTVIDNASTQEIDSWLDAIILAERAHYDARPKVPFAAVEQWFTQADEYKALRNTLWPKASATLHLKYAGLHPQAFTQLSYELHYSYIITVIGLEVRSSQTKAYVEEHQLSRLAFILLAVKWLLLIGVFAYWLKVVSPWLSKWQKQARHRWLKFSLRLVILFNPVVASLLFFNASMALFDQIAGLNYLQYIVLLVHWALALWLAQRILAYMLDKLRRRSSAKLRLKLKRQLFWILSLGFFVSLMIQFTSLLIGKGALSSWLAGVWGIWLVVVTVWLVNSWQSGIYITLYQTRDYPAWMGFCIKRRKHPFWRYFATLGVLAWLVVDAIKRGILRYMSRFVFFQQVLAYLFTMEVTKNTKQNNDANLVSVDEELSFEIVKPANPSGFRINYAPEAYAMLSSYLHGDKPALCVVSGERGMGATTVLQRLCADAKGQTLYVDCPSGGYEALLEATAKALEIEGEQVSETQIITHLKRSRETYLIALDNIQRIVTPTVGGLGALIKLTNLLRRGKTGHRIVFAIEKACWRFIDRARAERLLFDKVAFLPKWTEGEISQLFDSRTARYGKYKISFDKLDIPKQWDHRQLSDAQRSRSGFYRILWHYADGNPTIALRFFRQSLQMNQDTGAISVRLVDFPHSEELEQMPKPMLAILRAIVQLENASAQQLSQCTQLTFDEVLGTMRFFHSRGFIEMNEQQARISDQWFRFITNVLHQKHLLVK